MGQIFLVDQTHTADQCSLILKRMTPMTQFLIVCLNNFQHGQCTPVPKQSTLLGQFFLVYQTHAVDQCSPIPEQFL